METLGNIVFGAFTTMTFQVFKDVVNQINLHILDGNVKVMLMYGAKVFPKPSLCLVIGFPGSLYATVLMPLQLLFGYEFPDKPMQAAGVLLFLCSLSDGNKEA